MLRNTAIALLLAAAFSLSLFYRSYQDPLQFPVMILLGAAFLTALPRRAITLPSSIPVIFLIALLLLFTLGFAFSTVPFSSQIALCIFLAFPLAFFTASQGNRRPPGENRDDKREIQILLFPLLPLSVWAIVQGLTPNTRATGPFLDPNMLAALLTPGLICTAGIALYKRSFITALPAFLIFAALIATASRSGLIAAAIGLAVLVTGARATLRRRHLIAACIAALFILALLGGSLWHQIGDTGFNTPSVTDRLALWHAAWNMTMAHQVLGTGPGTFYLYYPAWRNPADQSLGHFAHSDILQLSAELGLAAPLLVYGFLTAILLRTRAALRRTQDTARHLAILTPFAALLTIAAQAHVNYPLFMLPVMLACGVLLALWHRGTAAVLGNGETIIALSLSKNILVTACGVLLLAGLLGLSFTASAGLYYLQKSRAATDPQTRLIALGWAERLGPLSFIAPEVEMARTNLDLITKTDSIKSPRLRKDLLAQTARLLDTAAYWNPAWAEIDFLRGEMEKIQGSKALMVTDWRAAIQKNPQHFQARQSLAEALNAEGRKDESLKIVRDGLNYPHTIAYRDWASSFLRQSQKQP